ncbi:zinc finger protein OZF-like [Phlebotomus papatasi]|uniref:zinc finger protein OZF-like n=1 Tax=Phlebotomus papatasi TaxID=29031 RepID=UPI002483BB12|nr:zinc finger protein OZF-like [Phlebotomus papatasi]
MEISDAVCRVCMREDEKITRFDDTLIGMIQFCTTIEIVAHDKLPNGICDQCQADLHVAYRFRTICEQSNEKFWELLTQLENIEIEEDSIIPKDEKSDDEEVSEESMKEEISEECLKEEVLCMSENIEALGTKVESIVQNTQGAEENIKNEEVPSVSDNAETLRNKAKYVVENVQVTKRRGRPRKNIFTDPEKSNSVKVQKNFQCTECGRTFTKQKLLSRHEKSHNVAAKETKSGKKVRVRRVAVKSDDGQRPCKFCKETFPSRKELNDHMNQLHVNERPYLCSQCGIRFVRNDYLVIHLRRHKGEKPYTCRYCGKGFPRATDLTVHERYHTGEKSHLCTTCGKSFHRAYNLLVHMRVHTGERPYHCPHCEKKFAQGNDLKAHIRRHTGERFKCDQCSSSFIQGYHLTQHKRQAHGIIITSHIRRVEKFHPETVKVTLVPVGVETNTQQELKDEAVWEQSM